MSEYEEIECDTLPLACKPEVRYPHMLKWHLSETRVIPDESNAEWTRCPLCDRISKRHCATYHLAFLITYKNLEIFNCVMGPFSITSKTLGEFNCVDGGSRFVMLHHLALLPHPLVDGKFPSENRRKLSCLKLVIFWEFGLKRY